VVDLNSAYKSAISELSYALSSGLLSKRDMLLAQVHRISHRMDEISYVRSVIEKDIRGEFGGIVDRLKNAEGKKVAIIQNEMAQLQTDIDKIDSLVENYETIKGDKISFLLRSRSLREDVENILLKVFKTDIDQTPYDLPRELKDLKDKLEKKTVGQQLLKLKDEIIWRLFNQKQLKETETIEKFNKTVADEIDSWAKLTDKYSEELKRYQMICFYCAEPLGKHNLNKKCKINEKKEIAATFTGFTQRRPEDSFFGNARHFWAKPKEDLFNTNQAFDNLQQLFTNQQTDAIKRKTMWEIENNLVLIKKLAREKNVNVENLLKSHDKNDLGMMSKPKFTYLLHEKLGVGTDKIDCFMMLLDPNQKGLINYRDFLQMMNDPELLKVDREVDGHMINKGIIGIIQDQVEMLSDNQSSSLRSPDIDMHSRTGKPPNPSAPKPQSGTLASNKK